MATDDLLDLIQRAREQIPEIPESAWHKFELVVRSYAGGGKIYVRANPKQRHLERIADLDGTAMREVDRASQIGISVRHLSRLRGLTR